MSQAQAATGTDRLPWLADEPPKRKRTGSTGVLAAVAAAAALLVAALFYWIGAHSWEKPSTPTQAAQPHTTVPLPQLRSAEPRQPQVIFEPAPEVRPAPQREVPIARPRVERHSASAAVESAPEASQTTTESEESAAPAAAPAPSASTPAQPAKAAPAATYKPLTPWPASQSAGAKGRIVRIGAFGSRQQAKLGWRFMVDVYPAVAHLQATVVEVPNSHGRRFYRFQIGTTSQAHSEVLCQRMEKIHLSCAVVGLPWKPRGVER